MAYSSTLGPVEPPEDGDAAEWAVRYREALAASVGDWPAFEDTRESLERVTQPVLVLNGSALELIGPAATELAALLAGGIVPPA